MNLKTLSNLTINDVAYIHSYNIENKRTEVIPVTITEITKTQLSFFGYTIRGISEADRKDKTEFVSQHGTIIYLNKVDALRALNEKLDKEMEQMLQKHEDIIINLARHYQQVREIDKEILKEDIYTPIFEPKQHE